MLKIFSIFFLFSILFAETSFEKVSEIEFNGDTFTTDNLGFVYLINKESIKKYSAEGLLKNTYSSSRFGKIASIDVANPMRILIFYKEFNHIVFLDNTLSEIRSAISLDDLNIEMTDLVCSSFDGGFWAFNAFTKQLLYYNQNLKLTHKGVEINSIIKKNSLPNFLIEKNNHVYLNMSNQETFVFDIFGNYEKTIHANIEKDFQVIENNLYFYSNQKFKRYQPRLLKTDTLNIPNVQDIISVRIEPNFIYLAKEKTISVYRN